MSDASVVDSDLVDQIVSHIPDWTWDAVKTCIINNIVDNMPCAVLERLTNDPCGFDRAEEILTDYYTKENYRTELITDSIKILGIEYTVNLLDSLDLQRFQKPV
jgi:hypothetical protein